MHYSTLVLVPKDTEIVRDAVDDLLAPYNENLPGPEKHWDWWQIGGRWTGVLSGYDPTADPQNQETCPLCSGTGVRRDKIGQELGYEARGWCNGCSGEGSRTKWPTQWAEHDGNIVPVEKVPEHFCPAAVITPDGEWHEVAMGWETTDENRSKFRALLENSPDTLAVIVDCHT